MEKLVKESSLSVKNIVEKSVVKSKINRVCLKRNTSAFKKDFTCINKLQFRNNSLWLRLQGRAYKKRCPWHTHCSLNKTIVNFGV